MRKKLILTLILMLGFIFFVSCDGTSTTEEPTIIETTETPTTEEPTTVIQEIELPDLDGLTLTEIDSILTGLGISYDIRYQTDLDMQEDEFISYVDFSEGDRISLENNIIVVVSTQDLVLPDLSGYNQIQIFEELLTLGFNFSNYTFEEVINNDVEDETFAGFKNHEIGDVITSSESFVILIGINETMLPDLTGMLEREIRNTLADNSISYLFTEVVDDDFPEGMFAYYADSQIGDVYEDGQVVEVVVYKNTFTNNEESLFISKYIESDIDSAIELYNPMDEAIDLTDYHLVVYANGSYDVTYRIDFEEGEAIEANSTYLVASTDSKPELVRIADLRSAILNFDGNDTIQLRYKNNTYIDTIYQIGDKSFLMESETFVRREGVVTGNREFSYGEWTSYVPGYYDIIGSHPINTEIDPSLTQSEINTLLTRGYYSPLGGMTLVELISVSDGDTASFTEGFANSARVRFLGVDTPETSPTVAPDGPEPWGMEAKAYTTTILEYADDNNLPIYIQSDPDLGYQETYGRHLGLIWVDLGDSILSIDIKDSDLNVIYTEQLTGMILVNYHVVKNGFSQNYYGNESELVVANRYMLRWFQEAELFAKEYNLGIHE